MKLSEADRKAIEDFKHEDVRCYSGSAGETRIERHDGTTVEYRGDLGWIIYRECYAYQLGLTVGVTVKAATANDLIDRLAAVLGNQRDHAAHELASGSTGFLRNVGTAQMQQSRWPKPMVVYGGDPDPDYVDPEKCEHKTLRQYIGGKVSCAACGKPLEMQRAWRCPDCDFMNPVLEEALAHRDLTSHGTIWEVSIPIRVAPLSASAGVQDPGYVDPGKETKGGG